MGLYLVMHEFVYWILLRSCVSCCNNFTFEITLNDKLQPKVDLSDVIVYRVQIIASTRRSLEMQECCACTCEEVETMMWNS